MKQVISDMGEMIIIIAFGFMVLRLFLWMGTQVLP